MVYKTDQSGSRKIAQLSKFHSLHPFTQEVILVTRAAHAVALKLQGKGNEGWYPKGDFK
jgi:hypothetical protein